MVAESHEAKKKLSEDISSTKTAIRDAIKLNQETENQVKCINRKIQERDYASSLCTKHRKIKC